MNLAKRKERELIIKLRKEGKTCVEVGKILDVSKSAVSYWTRRYNETGCLEDKPRPGRPTPLTEEKLQHMKKKITGAMLEQTDRAGLSSKEILIFIKKETGKTYTPRHIERLLHKMGFSLITPRVNHIKKDEKAQKKFRDEFKKNSTKSMWTIQ
ncbi:MAG: IS630 family transposase [Methanobacteriota archaeon]